MKYCYTFNKKSPAIQVAIYFAAAAVFFSICNLTYYSKAGISATLISFRAGVYFWEDLWFFLLAPITLVCVLVSAFLKKEALLLPPVLLAAWAWFCDAVDKASAVKWYVILPCVLAVLLYLLTVLGVLPSKWICAVGSIGCGLYFILPVFLKKQNLFFMNSLYYGDQIYLSKIACCMLILACIGAFCGGFVRTVKAEPHGESAVESDYTSVFEHDDTPDALKEESKVTKDDHIVT